MMVTMNVTDARNNISSLWDKATEEPVMIKQVLHKNNWTHLRTRDSHPTWSKPGYADVTVPIHAGRDLGRGLLASPRKQVGLTQAGL